MGTSWKLKLSTSKPSTVKPSQFLCTLKPSQFLFPARTCSHGLRPVQPDLLNLTKTEYGVNKNNAHVMVVPMRNDKDQPRNDANPKMPAPPNGTVLNSSTSVPELRKSVSDEWFGGATDAAPLKFKSHIKFETPGQEPDNQAKTDRHCNVGRACDVGKCSVQ